MQVKILENRNVVVEKNNAGTMNENAVTTLEFVFPSAYEDFDKKIVFVTKDGVLSDVIDDDTYTIKRSVTKYSKVYCYVSFFNDDDENFRSKEFLLKFYHNDEEDDELTEEETSVIDTLITTLNAQIQTAEDLVEEIQSQLESGEIGNGIENIEKTSSDGLVDTYTITFTDGTTTTFEVKNGASLEFTWSGTSLGIKTEEDEEYTYVDLQGEQGEQGETGNGIESIEKTSTEGLVDTYTITYTDGTTTTFTVTNGEEYDDTELQAKVTALEETTETQAEEIEELQEENERLRADIEATSITAQAEGETIYIDDSSNARLADMGISGNTDDDGNSVEDSVNLVVQNKNLLVVNDYEGTFYTSYADTGEIIFNEESCLQWRGGASAEFDCYLKPGTYTIVIFSNVESTSTATVFMRWFDSDNNILFSPHFKISNYIGTEVITSDTAISSVSFGYANRTEGDSIENEIYKIMILAGDMSSEDLEYEFGANIKVKYIKDLATMLEILGGVTDTLEASITSITTALADKFYNNAGAHNSIYRGKDITELLYDGALSEQIEAETFDDIYIGDYIVGQSSGNIYLVADINYYINTGYSTCLTPHIVLVPSKILGTEAMNSSATTERSLCR